jgi:AcrR family transcriptional regulator
VTRQAALDDPPRRRRRDLVTTRAALLDAAAEVFSRRGFDSATLDEIAEAAGFTRGAVHHHFASKEDLFLAVIARHDAELLAGFGADVLGSLPPDAAAASTRWRELHANDRREVVLRLELRRQALRNEALRAQLIEVDRAAVAATADRLCALGLRDGLSWRYPVEQVAQAFHLMSQAALERAVVTGEDATELMRMVLELVWSGSVTAPMAGR